MLQLSPHIKDLLLRYDCVVVPGLGGFVSSETCAGFDISSNRFLPPAKEISFNANLKHNDGLVCQSVMQELNVDFKSAQELVEKEVFRLKEQLASESFEIEGVGELFMNDSGKIVFRPLQNFASKRGFGLTSFYFPELEQEKEVAPNKSLEVRPINGSFSRWMAAASIFLMLLLFSRPTSQHDVQNAHVGLDLDTMMEEMASSPKTVVPKHEVDNDLALAENTKTPYISNVSLVSPEPEVSPSREYHVIIASLSEKSQADLFTLNYCLGQFKEYEVLESSNRYRVSIKSFNSKEAALPYLNEIRESHPFFADAWLLGVDKSEN